MPDLSGRDLLREWKHMIDSLISSTASLTGTDLPRQIAEPLQRQLELQRELAGYLLAPLDAVFDLLEESGTTLRRQAEALQAAGKAIEETATLMMANAELYERTIGALRQPTERAKSAIGLERRKHEE